MTDVRPGRPLPQGSTWDGEGVNFSVFSENAERVELCLLGDDGSERRMDIRNRTAHVWHVYVPGIEPGQRYGYRVHGPHAPEHGMRFNPAKLLIDPYAKAIDGPVNWTAANTLPYPPDEDDLTLDDTDDAAAIPGSVVVDQECNWEDDRLIGRRWSSTVIYETHVKGFTMRHPDVPEQLRHLCRAGVAAADRLPDEPRCDCGRAAAGPSRRRRELSLRQGPVELLGLQLDRLPRPARRIQLGGHAWRAAARVQDDGQDTAAGGDRGDHGCRLQPHRRGQPPRSDAVVQGDRQRQLLPPEPRGPAVRQHPRLLARRDAGGRFAQRFTGSADLYDSDGRLPAASINFITAHDGFTLADLGAYNDKHNNANLEDNQDGADDNRSWNCGVEGPTDDPEINAGRARQQRNFLATMLLSQGVPMLLGGDEFGRSQGGNNDAWCQDSEISWLDRDKIDASLQEFTRRVIELRQSEPVFRRRDFLVGDEVVGSGLPDVVWFGCDGEQMQDGDWEREDAYALGVFLNGAEIPTHDRDGHPIEGASFLMLFNAHHDPLTFTILTGLGASWSAEISSDLTADHSTPIAAGDKLEITSRSLLILRRDDR